MKIILSVLLIFLFTALCRAQYISELRYEDKIRIREAMQINNEFSDILWPGMRSAPFSLIIVTSENEYLFNYSNTPSDYTYIGFDTILQTNIHTRPRVFSNNLLLTMPAISSDATIVMGLPEATSRSSGEWVLTMLHEHFHQYQHAQPDYMTSVNAFNPSYDTTSGMWMMNYPFPYSDDIISAAYKLLVLAAKDAAFSDVDFKSSMQFYLEQRENFKKLLNKNDYAYFSFQVWQEGIARYTELKLAELLRGNYKPSGEFTQLDDYANVDSLYNRIIDKLKRRADTQELAINKRDCFYTIGALEGLILDKVNPDWREKYFKDKFYIENYFREN